MGIKLYKPSKRAFLKSILIIASWIFLTPLLMAQTTAIINGPTTVCPNNFPPSGPGGQNYSAQAVVLGINATCSSWQWWVLDGGFAIAGGFGNNFNYNFTDVGDFTIKFKGNSCGFFPFFPVENTISVTSRVKMPNPITGQNIICNPGQTYTYTSNPALDLSDNTCYYHYEYYWTAPAGWSINGDGNTFFGHGNSANIASPSNTPQGTYTISIQSTIPNPQQPGPPPNNVFLSLPRNYTVRVGPFDSHEINLTGATQICNGNAYTYTANLPGGHQSGYTYSWTYPSGWIVENISANTIRLYVPSNNNSYGPVRVSVSNTCGTSPFTGFTTFPGMNCNFMTAGNFKIYPNPSDGELNVEYDWSIEPKNNSDFNKETEDSTNDNLKPEFKIELFDKDQKMIKKEESVLGKIQMDTGNLQPGTYFLHIHFENEVLMKQIKVK